MAVTKPQKPLMVNDQEIYPLTHADQIIMASGERLPAAISRFIVPAYTTADYGKILGCGVGGLQWVDSLGDLNNVEGVSY